MALKNNNNNAAILYCDGDAAIVCSRRTGRDSRANIAQRASKNNNRKKVKNTRNYSRENVVECSAGFVLRRA